MEYPVDSSEVDNDGGSTSSDSRYVIVGLRRMDSDEDLFEITDFRGARTTAERWRQRGYGGRLYYWLISTGSEDEELHIVE